MGLKPIKVDGDSLSKDSKPIHEALKEAILLLNNLPDLIWHADEILTSLQSS
jgi:hypothetical protein